MNTRSRALACAPPSATCQPLEAARHALRVFRCAALKPSAAAPSVDYYALATAAQLTHVAVAAAAPFCAGDASSSACAGAPVGFQAAAGDAASRNALVAKWASALATFKREVPASANNLGAVLANIVGTRLGSQYAAAARAIERARAWEEDGGAKGATQEEGEGGMA
jgi:hypothetical protein